ncbi:hypothetical protein MPLB_1700049 [Mesorhizobium sp. ORS 3324]|nr:hypothetical protein MPLB_1700049 [Mesorhizobium sp. ORS 3324]
MPLAGQQGYDGRGLRRGLLPIFEACPSTECSGEAALPQTQEWTALRERGELSHVIRTALAMPSPDSR